MSYLKVLGATLIGVLAFVATLNWAIDPYAMNWDVQLTGINDKKIEAGDRVRNSKPQRVRDVNPQILLVGNSRIEMGISAESPLFSGKRVFNHGLPGVALSKQIDVVLQELEHNSALEEVIFSLDFLDFLYAPGDFQDRARWTELNATKTPGFWSETKSEIAYLFSLNTLFSSLNTVLGQSRDANYTTINGTNIASGYLPAIRHEGVDALFINKLVQLNQRLSGSQSVFTASDPAFNPGVEQIELLIQRAAKHNVTLTFFISPVHYSYLHLLADHGHWNNYVAWKKLLASACI